ncbi:hypothetical protein GGX14DRAFT_395665 [Mycena pura]|uniref:Uncharacterized protein n=1 Tax=Mycena pura TaxID=153505 RepID=A0AAD6YE78_9AGAR|nr:hypothetical protein GGX14DRAFT_395665 [Mycena pura]
MHAATYQRLSACFPCFAARTASTIGASVQNTAFRIVVNATVIQIRTSGRNQDLAGAQLIMRGAGSDFGIAGKAVSQFLFNWIQRRKNSPGKASTKHRTSWLESTEIEISASTELSEDLESSTDTSACLRTGAKLARKARPQMIAAGFKFGARQKNCCHLNLKRVFDWCLPSTRGVHRSF